MGIYGLQKFMQISIKGGYEPINVPELALLYKNETGQDPIMVVDISSCILHMTPFKERSAVVGRDLKKLRKNLRKFIDECWRLGIKLLVVNDGMKTKEKFDNWVTKSEKAIACLQKFYSGRKVKHCAFWRTFDFGLVLTAAMEVFLSTDKCEYRRANFESDHFILDYIKKFKCFAILTEDSDFIIAEGVRYCISAKALNLETMTSYNYNKTNLANFLGINVSQLPLFGLLCNEVSSIRDLNFNMNNQFSKVAELLQDFSWKVEKPYFLEELLEQLGIKSEKACELREKLKRYYGEGEIDITYTIHEYWNKVLRLAKIRHTLQVSHKNLLEILSERRIMLSPMWANYRNTEAVVLLKLLRIKMYKLLFYEYPGTEEIIIIEHYFKKIKPKECVKPYADRVKVGLRSYPHSGLCALWSENPTIEIITEKQNLFCRIFNEKLNFEDLKSNQISEDLIFPLLATFYLLWEVKRNLKSYEVQALLFQAVLTKHLTENEVDELEDEYERDCLDLSSWFVRVIDHLRLLNNVCGEPFSIHQTNLINYFDLKILHNVYRKAKRQVTHSKMYRSDIRMEYNSLFTKLQELGEKCGFSLSQTAT